MFKIILFGDSIDEYPSLKHDVADTKYSTENAKINEKVINYLLYPVLVKPHGSNSSDRKNDARKESRVAFNELVSNKN